MNPRIKKVTPLEGYKLRIEFNNGETGEYDCTLLLEFGVFKELKNVQYFKSVTVAGGTVAWPNKQDICPDTLCLESMKMSEKK